MVCCNAGFGIWVFLSFVLNVLVVDLYCYDFVIGFWLGFIDLLWVGCFSILNLAYVAICGLFSVLWVYCWWWLVCLDLGFV